MQHRSFPRNAVFTTSTGRMFSVIDNSRYDSGTGEGIVCVQFVDKDECSFIEGDKLDISSSSTSTEAWMIFSAARSIHIRLNRMNKV